MSVSAAPTETLAGLGLTADRSFPCSRSPASCCLVHRRRDRAEPPSAGAGRRARIYLKEAVHGDLLTELGITLWRVAASFFVAMADRQRHRLAMGECRLSTGRSILG